MKRALVWSAMLALGGVAGWQAALALQETPAAEDGGPANLSTDMADAAAQPRSQVPGNRIVTPMPERVAVLGILNKRNGLSRDIALKPGQAWRMGDLIVRLRACEETDPWEAEKWTGAFVQVLTRQSSTTWRKIFSGWVYKESPSLNVVEHPIYDVWVKACKMRHADVGPDTVLARGAPAGRSASSADKSPDAADEGPEPDSAAPSLTE